MMSPETQLIDVSVKDTPISRKHSIEQGRRKTNGMGYLFEIENLSEEPTIRLRQLWDLQAKYTREAREKVYKEITIENKNRGITFDDYLAGFGFYNYYIFCRSELEHYLSTGIIIYTLLVSSNIFISYEYMYIAGYL
ncbi:hypothetical protein DPMN_149221 [Dreissena polymorpha]|uniref:Uncharacterized protein n=1 Tax=Dreissena polymorpha TaxID=45954 RepID=A0A9D4J291_DREPO|nr:hypothetical protein DPMN_149221 [Dreissena polymorpha]